MLSAFIGSSSPASLQGYTPYNHHLHAAVAPHHHMLPAPMPAWEAKQQAVITQSAHSHLVSRPQLQTGNAVITQSAHSHLVSSPQLQTGNAVTATVAQDAM